MSFQNFSASNFNTSAPDAAFALGAKPQGADLSFKGFVGRMTMERALWLCQRMERVQDLKTSHTDDDDLPHLRQLSYQLDNDSFDLVGLDGQEAGRLDLVDELDYHRDGYWGRCQPVDPSVLDEVRSTGPVRIRLLQLLVNDRRAHLEGFERTEMGTAFETAGLAAPYLIEFLLERTRPSQKQDLLEPAFHLLGSKQFLELRLGPSQDWSQQIPQADDYDHPFLLDALLQLITDAEDGETRNHAIRALSRLPNSSQDRNLEADSVGRLR